MRHFNMIVIGKGLVGAAAAKYLSNDDSNVALIGPDEPTNYIASSVFGSHFDQTRIQRIIGKGPVWTKLNVDAASQYEHIQGQSGIPFHTPTGCLYVNPAGMDKYLKEAPILSKSFDRPVKVYSHAKEIVSDFGDFEFPPGAQGLFEAAPAGFINPRLLIKAQLHLFEKEKGTILRETVLDVHLSQDEFKVKTREGNIYSSQSILVATGSFVNFLNLLPRKLALKSKSEVVVLVKVQAGEAEKFSRLPSLLYEIDDGQTEGIYLVQPVQYPDGDFYLKIGCNTPEDIPFQNIEQVQDWFRYGDSDRFAPRMTKALRSILPNLTFTEYQTKKCITSFTSHGRPYIGETTQRGLFVAGGCNGYSAMCSDAIGNIAAHLMIKGHMPAGYTPDDFTLHYMN